MKRLKLNWLQLAVHIRAWSLVVWLVWDYFTGNLTVNPIQAATQRTGKIALIMLVLSLSCTPLNTLFGWRQALATRRILGLYAFLFATTHFLIFSGVDFQFNWDYLKPEILEKRYIIVGLASLSILFLLAVTSFRWWKKRLGRNWKRLHRLVYLASGLVILHYAWAKKGDIFRLQGDILQPLFFGILVAMLLILRIPVVRSAVSKLRWRLIQRLSVLESKRQPPDLKQTDVEPFVE